MCYQHVYCELIILTGDLHMRFSHNYVYTFEESRVPQWASCKHHYILFSKFIYSFLYQMFV